jgi:hypothetical protein
LPWRRIKLLKNGIFLRTFFPNGRRSNDRCAQVAFFVKVQNVERQNVEEILALSTLFDPILTARPEGLGARPPSNL